MRTRTKLANHVTWVGFFANLILFALKLAAGVIGQSGAMIADAVHSLSDVATDLVVIGSFKIADKPVDENHDYGHGKFETLATAFVGGSLLVVGSGIFWKGISTIWSSFNGVPINQPGFIALFAAVISVITKELLYRYTLNTSKRIKSQTIIANAWHHRSDAFSSIATMAGIGGALLLGERWHVLDPLAAILVSTFIVRIALLIFIDSLKKLTDESLDEDTKKKILQIATDHPAVCDAHNLRTRHVGNDIAIDFHIRVDPQMQVSEAHRIASIIEVKLRHHFGEQTFISVHIEPKPDRGGRSDQMAARP